MTRGVLGIVLPVILACVALIVLVPTVLIGLQLVEPFYQLFADSGGAFGTSGSAMLSPGVAFTFMGFGAISVPAALIMKWFMGGRRDRRRQPPERV